MCHTCVLSSKHIVPSYDAKSKVRRWQCHLHIRLLHTAIRFSTNNCPLVLIYSCMMTWQLKFVCLFCWSLTFRDLISVCSIDIVAISTVVITFAWVSCCLHTYTHTHTHTHIPFASASFRLFGVRTKDASVGFDGGWLSIGAMILQSIRNNKSVVFMFVRKCFRWQGTVFGLYTLRLETGN
jgi:hypothetical protein